MTLRLTEVSGPNFKVEDAHSDGNLVIRHRPDNGGWVSIRNEQELDELIYLLQKAKKEFYSE